MTAPVHASRRDLLALPDRDWNATEKWWGSLLIVPTRKKHDSGFAHIAIIGVEGQEAVEILAMPDDIQWPAHSSLPGMANYGAIRSDAYWPSGVLRLWSNAYDFSVSSPISSVEILLCWAGTSGTAMRRLVRSSGRSSREG